MKPSPKPLSNPSTPSPVPPSGRTPVSVSLGPTAASTSGPSTPPLEPVSGSLACRTARASGPSVSAGVSAGRRRLLGAGVATALAAFLGTRERALATVEDMERAIAAFGGQAVPRPGGIVLTLPEIAENGRSVPMSFEVDSPMTESDHVEAVMVLAPENPNTRVATFRFTPASGTARVTTRMRLERTQDVVAIARMSDGTLRSTSRAVEVTIGGCSA